MKTHIITFSKNYPKGHPLEGSSTQFREKILGHTKIHTIRTNYEWWAPKIKEVQEGKAILSLRYWEGQPYRSKQDEFKQLTQDDGIGVQRAFVRSADSVIIESIHWQPELVASNDGLTLSAFNNWFKRKPVSGVVIHLTDFRYSIGNVIAESAGGKIVSN